MREVMQHIYVPHTKDIDRLELIQRHVIILAGVSSFIGWWNLCAERVIEDEKRVRARGKAYRAIQNLISKTASWSVMRDVFSKIHRKFGRGEKDKFICGLFPIFCLCWVKICPTKPLNVLYFQLELPIPLGTTEEARDSLNLVALACVLELLEPLLQWMI